MDEWDYYTFSLVRDVDGEGGERSWKSLEYDVRLAGCSPFRRNFNYKESLSEYERRMIAATESFKPVFRIYEEGTTGQLRIFWMSNHPWVDEWQELGAGSFKPKPIYYRTLDHVNQSIDSVKHSDIFGILRYKPATGFEDVIYGKLLKEISV